MEKPMSKYHQAETVNCSGDHICLICGATEPQKRLIKYSHLDIPGNTRTTTVSFADYCEDCFCAGCHFNDMGCGLPPEIGCGRLPATPAKLAQAMAQAIADNGPCR